VPGLISYHILFLPPGLGSSAEHFVFVQDETEDSGADFLSAESTDSSIPWFLRVQELAHDSLIAATRAQLAKNAKTGSNGEIPGILFSGFSLQR
jgi:hypothetical protein